MNYCKNWGICEGIRELLQNQMDGISSSIGKSNIQVEPYNPARNDVKYQFGFFHKDDIDKRDPFGEIYITK